MQRVGELGHAAVHLQLVGYPVVQVSAVKLHRQLDKGQAYVVSSGGKDLWHANAFIGLLLEGDQELRQRLGRAPECTMLLLDMRAEISCSFELFATALTDMGELFACFFISKVSKAALLEELQPPGVNCLGASISFSTKLSTLAVDDVVLEP